MYTVEFEVIGKDEFTKGIAQHVYNFKEKSTFALHVFGDRKFQERVREVLNNDASNPDSTAPCGPSGLLDIRRTHI